MRAREFLGVIPEQLHSTALRVLPSLPSMRGVLVFHPLSDQVYDYRVFIVQRMTMYFQGLVSFESIINSEPALQEKILKNVHSVELKTPIDAEDFRRLTYYHKNSCQLFAAFKRHVLAEPEPLMASLPSTITTRTTDQLVLETN